ATYNDAVAVGLVASLAHPGGNVTGSTFFAPELMAKRIERLKEIVPSMSRAGVLLLRRDDTAATVKTVEVMEATAKALRVELHPIEVRELGEYGGRIFRLERSANRRARRPRSRAVHHQRRGDHRSRSTIPLSVNRAAGAAYSWRTDGLRSELCRHVS